MASPGGSQTSALRASPPERAYGHGLRRTVREALRHRREVGEVPPGESGTPSAEALFVACATGTSETATDAAHAKAATSELLRAPARAGQGAHEQADQGEGGQQEARLLEKHDDEPLGAGGCRDPAEQLRERRGRQEERFREPDHLRPKQPEGGPEQRGSRGRRCEPSVLGAAPFGGFIGRFPRDPSLPRRPALWCPVLEQIDSFDEYVCPSGRMLRPPDPPACGETSGRSAAIPAKTQAAARAWSRKTLRPRRPPVNAAAPAAARRARA